MPIYFLGKIFLLKLRFLKILIFLLLILFFPNMHFWTASLGKGAPIFLGLMMFAYAIKKPKSRLITLIFGSILIYFIRPHVFLFVAVGTVLGYMSGKEKISFGKKLIDLYSNDWGIDFSSGSNFRNVAGLEDSEDIVDRF